MSAPSDVWPRARAIFLEVVGLPADERQTRLRERCGDDPVLVRAVTGLLAGHDDPDGGVDRLTAEIGDPLAWHLRESRGGTDVRPPADRYRVVRELGRGGMGVVHLARDTSLGRLVAIKTLEPSIAESAAARRRLLEEARVVAALDHPNIVTIHEVGIDDRGALFLVFAHSDGETLKALLARRTPLPVKGALEIAASVARALAAAHGAGIVHRDVKPSNILLSTDGTTRLTDFGIADRSEAAGGIPRAPAGTPAYMPPEQRAGGPADGRSDLWSLGLVLREMLLGPAAEGPGSRGAPPPGDVDRSERTGDPRLDAILARALAPDPDRRYQRAEELLADIERVAGTPPGAVREADAPAARRRPAWRVAALLLALLVASLPTGAHPGPAGPPGSAPGRLLWVDDDPRASLEETGHLEALGFRVTRVAGTGEALAAYDPAAFDLVITDLGRLEAHGYNDRAGLDLLAGLRRGDPNASVIFFTSSRAAERFRDAALAAGALGITSSTSELYELVRRPPPR